jgi:hypothetical protein
MDKTFNVPDENEIFSWIEDMYALGPRRIGTHADHLCEDYLAEHLKSAGFDSVIKTPIPIRLWEPESFSLETQSAKNGGYTRMQAHYIPYTAFTSREGVEGELLYVRPGDASKIPAKEWKGRVILTDIEFPGISAGSLESLALFMHDPDKNIKETVHPAPWIRYNWQTYLDAVRHGAAGFIGILKDHYVGGQNYYAPYGFLENDIHDKPLPGFWVDRKTGVSLRRIATREKRHVRLTLTGKIGPGVTHNVTGVLKGKSDEVFLIGCHHDAPFASAVEDASGCSVVLAAAKHFAGTRKLRRTLIVNFSAGHFYGSIGTRSFIAQNKGCLLNRVALEFHVEHIAREAIQNKDGSLTLLDRPEPVGAFASFNRNIINVLKNAVLAENLSRLILLPPEGPLGSFPPTDGGDYYAAGVPLVNFISSPVYLLNSEDTLEKIAHDRLVPTTRTLIRVLNDLDDVPMRELRANHFPVRTVLMRLLTKVVRQVSKSKGVGLSYYEE